MSKKQDENTEVNKGGRPPKLQPTSKTLNLVRQLGRIRATTLDCAAFLEVDEKTFIKFRKDHPAVLAAYDEGTRSGKTSLRMAQYRLAVEKLHPTMLIWLGKQELGQRDHKDIGGPGGGPIPVMDMSKLSDMDDKELEALESAFAKLGLPSGDPSGETETES